VLQRKALRPIGPGNAVDVADTLAADVEDGPLVGKMLPAELAVLHMEIVEPVDAHFERHDPRRTTGVRDPAGRDRHSDGDGP
jgi:hypothetical protein